MSLEKSHDALKTIWDKVAVQAPDGKKYIIFKGKSDLEYLYCTGFVDETKFSMDEWVDSFADSLTPIGAYMVGEDQWMDKVRFHYSGRVGEPFDPMTLREGNWEEGEFQELAREKILPSIFFNAEEFAKILEEVKKRGFYVDGKYRMTRPIKEDLVKVLNDYPSPRRARELAVQEARGSKGVPLGATSTTGFTKDPSASQMAAERLQQLMKKK